MSTPNEFELGSLSKMPQPKEETCNILLLGKTGLGKTTTARRLLEWERCRNKIHSLDVNNATPIEAWQNSATNVRVVDVPGFADTAANPMLIH